MDRLRAFLAQVLAFFRTHTEDAELEEEMRFHLEREVESNVWSGMSPKDARRKALRDFGGIDGHKERVRDERGFRLLGDLLKDFRFGLRNLGKRPVFALAAIATLSVGIGMTTTMFTLVDGVLLRPLPVSRAEGKVYLELEDVGGQATTSPTPQLLRLIRDHASAFSRVEAYTKEEFDVTVDGEPLRASGARVSPGFFSYLGVSPVLGRGFVPEDGLGTGDPVVVLSHTLWTDRFGRETGVLGRTLRIGGRIHEIVGVLPREFRVDSPVEALLWIPEGAAAGLLAEGVPVEGALAELAPGVSLEAARAELEAIIRNNPLDRLGNLDWVPKVHLPADLIDPSLRRAIIVLQAAALLVLLIGCGNLANLLLAQGETRAHELALRASLGAGQGRLIRQLLVENLALGALGGAGGVILTIWALGSLPIFLPPGYGGFALNRTVLLFAVGTSLVSVLAAGLMPALKGSRRDLAAIIKRAAGVRGSSLRHPAGRHFLVTVEVAMAFVLLVSAGLLLKSFSGLLRGDVGFDREDLLVVRLQLPEERYGDDETRLTFFDRLQSDVREGFPDQLGRATMASGLVEDLALAFTPLVPEGAEGGEEERFLVVIWTVAQDYFDVVGVPMLRGRSFAEEDGRGAENVVVINETAARRYFPEDDPVGHRLRLRDEWYRVVGVAGSVRLPALAQNRVGDLQLFFPFRQRPDDVINIVARVTGSRSQAADFLKAAIWGIDSSLPILDVSMAEDLLVESLAQERSNAILMILFAVSALLLGAVGIYGVVACSVTRRFREMGVRLALGATSREVVALVLKGGMKTVGLGMLFGVAGALVVGRSLSPLLFEVDPNDPIVLLLGCLLTAGAAFVSTWLPARRVAGSGPVEALRQE